jgi:hypothetical protein
MSRKRNKQKLSETQQKQGKIFTGAQYPRFEVKISLLRNGNVQVDPDYNKVAIAHFDSLYEHAGRDDYNPNWSDDHKIAFFISDMMDVSLQQWESPISPNETEEPISEIPNIKDNPVVERYDIANTIPIIKRNN